MPAHPRFSVCLPVRNGGAYLKACVASILAQTLADDFELLILENGSTDGTAEWLATLSDPRVRVLPALRPLSIEENWSRIKDLPKREFLTIIGHDDLLDPDFLETVAALVRQHPDASLFQTHFRLIDAGGGVIRRCHPMPSRETAAEFLAARLCDLRDSFGTGYVLRSAHYDALGGIPSYAGLLYADDALFLQATALSCKATALAETFSYRLHAASISGAAAGHQSFSSFEQYCELLQTLQSSDEAIREVLRRHFAHYATFTGLRWLTAERLAALRSGRAPDPAIEERVTRVAGLFGGGPVSIERAGVMAQLLAKAGTSRIHRFLYRLLSLPLMARQSLRARLQRTLAPRSD